MISLTPKAAGSGLRERLYKGTQPARPPKPVRSKLRGEADCVRKVRRYTIRVSLGFEGVVMKRSSLNCARLLVVIGMIAGCGDDDTGAALGDGGPDGAIGAGTGGIAGMLPPPAGGGAGGTGQGMTSNPGGNTAPAVRCGAVARCPVPLQSEYNLLAGFASGFGFPLPAGGTGLLPTACCTRDTKCGLVVSNGCVPPPKSDRRCPDVTVLSVTAPGCCIESRGVCGANGAQSGQGCVDVSGAGFGVLFGLPPPTRCGDAGMMQMTDSGMADSGMHDAGHPSDDAGQDDAGK